MRKYFILFSYIVLLAACKKDNLEKKALSKEELKAKVDSIVRERTIELNKESDLDLRYRMKIEAKVIADSILQSKKKVKIDSSAKTNNK